MPQENEDKVAHLLDELATFARGRLPAAMFNVVAPFLQHYYDQADAEDLLQREVADLYGAVMAHWQTAQKFTPGSARIRVYNPNLEEHGWHSDHTVVEIVNDDMPFLVDSVTMEINRQGLALHSAIHPVFRVWRGGNGIERIAPAGAGEAGDNSRLESFIHFEIDRTGESSRLDALRNGISQVLVDVRAAVEDWPKMCEITRATIGAMAQAPDAAAPESVEARAFLEWMMDDHFSFLGQRDYQLIARDGRYYLRGVAGSGAGILRESLREPDAEDLTPLPAAATAIIEGSAPIFLTKANSRATVHRPGYLDYVGVKLLDENGQLFGERRFVGLYTSTAYMAPIADIPLVRRKCANILARAGFLAKGHLYKSLVTILEQYPRDELFQATEDELFDITTGILRLQEHQRTRLFVRRDRFDRFVSCLVFVPRDKYNTDLRQKIQKLLTAAFHGTSCEFTPLLSESPLARIQLTVRGEPGTMPKVDTQELEARIVHASRRWQDDLAEALHESHGEEQGNRLLQRYGGSFPAGYREDYPARTAVRDIELMEHAVRGNGMAMNLYRPIEAAPGAFRFKVYRAGAPIALSLSLPMLEHLGVRVDEERPYLIEPDSGEPVWVHDFGLEIADSGGAADFDIARVKALFEDAFARAWHGEIENDDLNRLVLRAELAARDVTILRAYARYLRQVGSTFSDAYIERALTGNAGIAAMLVALFVARFDTFSQVATDTARQARCDKLLADIGTALDKVPNLDEDRILRLFLGVINATVRTNYFHRGEDGQPRPYLSFKFNPALVPGLPEPRPMFEIWVYSPRVEGVHLRGGRVARGGLRWSDRREDFRTEVLGLMKAQMVKNTVIVPVGSKGGFVVKRPPPPTDRDAFLREGIACYQTFLRGLLDLTDNLVGGELVPPPDVVRHDDNDPYLVVAADKGTATFSDFANAISAEYGFWLGDAFASGGSVGYDHKKMGITARGAWESVKRHFREMGVDIQATDFTVAGIGDMSGDVFGNGMLLSPHIRLVAAFDHRHIFLDPDPDPARSLQERTRLFGLPRSSWADYDATLISAGGGVFPRTAKTVPLSPQVQAVLGITATALSPAELIHAILMAPVDLLYNGGIGTYVKSSQETHLQAGDRTNDAVRVNGSDLRCKVVGEGGNLGFTQLGRIEFARKGGRINTDAIDNSAGVDCSDHEVNIKILLGLVVADGEMTEKQRNKLLAEMTDEVGLLVLQDNYYQTQALSVAGRSSAARLDGEARLVRWLERAGRLNRALEFLPSDEDIAERKLAGEGLTSPERAVLLAYSKMWLYDELLGSDVPEDALVAGLLADYFPVPLRQRYGDAMQRHPLRREILSTHLTNMLVNRIGATFVHRIMEETDARPADIVRACLIARDVFGLTALWQEIDALDNRVADAEQARMFGSVALLLERACLWFIRYLRSGSSATENLARFAQASQWLAPRLSQLLPQADAAALTEHTRALIEAGVGETLAMRVAGSEISAAALDIAEVAAACERSLDLVAGVYFALDSHLSFSWLRERALALPSDTHWDLLARTTTLEDLGRLKRALTVSVLSQSGDQSSPEAMIDAWRASRHGALERFTRMLADQRASGAAGLSMLSVAVREIGMLERS
ncbi:NAD-glutamate dehydrogenase [Cupriavidus taiwanensis]|uniref:Putative NAD-glutamate dehydrogenase n=1 Tax=Cupriavidus taiwanensis TaxID=164546 RepID=A0A7Z7JAF8_9BURK|nr:NAD-glutamate dehydrogenase [Cupriavidus taiwanensis]SOY85768.1 putative NAD-glutamate dehydrogenase [Cupriavidus taiwanensis]SOZ05187.1 putative NAD-glutamate dehydrogenase [Cupriavidus taiwanensis]SPC09669.1 putative NAD-glutamate dehydrogenase [Cupriavidus taiwanensis]SPD39456.1 NAD-specific glutamate dehydrogenase [Cupriavidus taiwanensis]